MNNYKILVASLIFTEKAMLERSGMGITPATRRWLLGFVDGIKSNENEAYLMGHEIASFYPKGHIFPGCKNDLMFKDNSHIVRYFNFWPIRWMSLRYSYKNNFNKVKKKWGEFKYVVSYNAWPNQISLGKYIKNRHPGTKWILIILDHDDPNDNFNSFIDKTIGVDYYIFLSKWAYENVPVNNKYLLEGGVNFDNVKSRFKKQVKSIRSKKINKTHIILYSGMFSEWGGVNLLIDAFNKIKGSNVELWICGFGNDLNIRLSAEKNKNINLFGMVSEDELYKLSLRASVLINPRPKNVNGNLMNFPSKLLEYLTYCKPVISTRTPGIPKEYEDICYMVDDDADSIGQAILVTINKDNDDLLKLATNTFNFLKNKTWSSQIAKLNAWIES